MKKKIKKKIGIVGHFGLGEKLLNGQTIKTINVTTELEHQFGADNVFKVDTRGWKKKIFKLLFSLIKAFKTCDNILIFPAHNGVRVFVPLCAFFNAFFHRSLNYVVIGGWLPDMLKSKPIIKHNLIKYSGIYVETSTMKKALEEQGFYNVFILNNFKQLEVVDGDLPIFTREPFPICTFSRVMKEKGIEDLVNVVIDINKKANKTVFLLDIYGQVDSAQTEWFDNLQKSFPFFIEYKGAVDFDQSTGVLKNYYLLCFPTKFYTEGIPGTIIDAYAAGVPVIASKWQSFDDVIDDGKTGIGYVFDDLVSLQNVLENITPEQIFKMKHYCIEKASLYLPKNAIKALTDNLA